MILSLLTYIATSLQSLPCPDRAWRIIRAVTCSHPGFVSQNRPIRGLRDKDLFLKYIFAHALGASSYVKRIPQIIWFLLGIICYPSYIISAQELEPKLLASPSVFEFGTVVEGSIVEATYKLKNVGTGELRIVRVISGCGCTVAKLPQAIINPGMEVQLQIRYDTTGFWGEKTRYITIHSNDRDQPQQALALKGLIETDIKIDPNRIVLDEFTANEVRAIPLKVMAASFSSSKIKGVVAVGESINLNVRESSTSNWVGDVIVTSDLGRPEIKDRIVVTITSGKGERNITVPVTGKVNLPYKIEPPAVSLGIIRDGDRDPKTLKIQAIRGQKLIINSFKPNDRSLSVGLITIKEEEVYLFKVVPPPLSSLAGKDFKSHLIIDSNHGEIRIPVYGVAVR